MGLETIAMVGLSLAASGASYQQGRETQRAGKDQARDAEAEQRRLMSEAENQKNELMQKSKMGEQMRIARARQASLGGGKSDILSTNQPGASSGDLGGSSYNQIIGG